MRPSSPSLGGLATLAVAVALLLLVVLPSPSSQPLDRLRLPVSLRSLPGIRAAPSQDWRHGPVQMQK